MTDARFDVAGFGNAMVDVLVHTDEAFLDRFGMVKGAMTLVDQQRASELYAAMPPGIEISGGSCANTMAGIASLGGRAVYFGKVSSDQLGEVFRHDIRASGVTYDVPPATGLPSGRCLIFVTPDAQRTMNTYLGSGADLGPEDVDDTVIAASAITFIEGYLWDPARAKEAVLRAARTARHAGRKVALTLSDPFCVERHRAEFVELAEQHVDILFANETEILSLYQVEHFDDALQRVRAHCEVAALTRSEKGSVVVSGDEVHIIQAERVGDVVDTTGAGDLYAAGFMHAYANGRDLATCGRIASICAAEVISHFGARPEQSLADLVRERLG